VTPNGHSVGSVTEADSIGQNAVATATPASTIQVYTVVKAGMTDWYAYRHTCMHGLSPAYLPVRMNTCIYAHMPTSYKHTRTQT